MTIFALTRVGSPTRGRSGGQKPSSKPAEPVNATDALILVATVLTLLPLVIGFSWRIATPAGSLFYADLALLLLFILLVIQRNLNPEVLVLSLVLLIYAGINIASGNGLTSFQWVLRDSRPFFYFIVGVAISGYLLGRPQLIIPLIRTVIAVVGLVAVLSALSQVLETPLVGASDNYVYFGGSNIELASRRVQTSTTAAGLFLMCLLAAGQVRGVNLRVIGGWWLLGAIAGSVVLTVLSYSRNSLLAIAVAMVVAVAAFGVTPLAERISRTIGLVLLATLAVVIFVVLAGLLGGIFADVVDAFDGRVVSGVQTDAVTTDPSVLWRVDETRLALDSIRENPLGTGFGEFYRAAQANEPFRGNDGRLYVHNFFFVWMVKLGVVVGTAVLGAAALGAAALFFPRRHCSRENRETLIATGCAFLGMCAANFVSPSFASRDFAMIFGVVVGIGWIMARRSPGREEVNQSLVS